MINKSFRFLPALVLGLACATASVSASVAETVSGAQLKKDIPGRYTVVVYGFEIGVNASANGNVVFTFLDDKFEGSWGVKGDQLCITLKDEDESVTECSAVQFDGKYFTAGGVSFYAK